VTFDRRTLIDGASFRGSRLPITFWLAQGEADTHGATYHCYNNRTISEERLRGLIATSGCLPPRPPPSDTLNGLDLSGFDYGSAWMMGLDLTGSVLRGTNLRNADLTGALLDGADLRGAIFDRWTIWPEGFDPLAAGAIAAAMFYTASRSGGSLASIHLPATLLSPWEQELGIEVFVPDAAIRASARQLAGMDLAGATLTGAWLQGADLRETSLVGADLTFANLTSASLQGADLSAAVLTGAITRDADFTGAIYDALTVFPEGFDPVEAGMIDMDDASPVANPDSDLDHTSIDTPRQTNQVPLGAPKVDSPIGRIVVGT
jgi:uncharacterized protein YjbI with pentapeptide repeats